MDHHQREEGHQEEEEGEAPREESNDFTISIPGRGATNFVIGVGVGSVIFLLFYGCFNILQDIFSYNLRDPNLTENEFILLLGFKSIFFLAFPVLSIIGIILNFLLRFHPSLINRLFCQPVILLIPTIFPLGYLWIMALFQMINSLTILADEILSGNAWAYVIISTFKFLSLLFSLSWYYVLIQVAFGQYKIAKELNSRNSSSTPTTTAAAAAAASQTIPLQSPPHLPQQSNFIINLENDNLTDSSETPLSPFNI
uniref:Uncharacterized protein n=1 Tax=Panagrolaimus superbus TaxID=310955 RepID=A0A914YY37_9BILA